MDELAVVVVGGGVEVRSVLVLSTVLLASAAGVADRGVPSVVPGLEGGKGTSSAAPTAVACAVSSAPSGATGAAASVGAGAEPASADV